jgi:hypothetical protein
VAEWEITGAKKNPLAKNIKFNRHKGHKEDSENEAESEEDSSSSHGSGFAGLGREQKEEEEKRRNLGQAEGSEQKDDEGEIENEEGGLALAEPVDGSFGQEDAEGVWGGDAW